MGAGSAQIMASVNTRLPFILVAVGNMPTQALIWELELSKFALQGVGPPTTRTSAGAIMPSRYGFPCPSQISSYRP